MSDTLKVGESLTADQSLASAHGFARLTFQADGNLVLTCSRPAGWSNQWATNTAGLGADRCTLQADGHLVLAKGDTPVWSTPVGDVSETRLDIQDDENVVIYTAANTPIWASNTSLDGTPIQGPGPQVWYLFQAVRHGIPDPETLQANYGGWAAVTHLSDEQVNLWPEGDPIPSVIQPPLSALRVCSDKPANGSPHPPRTIPQPPPQILPDGSVIASEGQPLVGQTDKMWDVGATLGVKLVGGTPFIRGKVRQYAEIWTQYANIHFAWVDPAQAADINVHFDAGKGSWSAVGRDAQWIDLLPDPVTMNFGWFTDNTDDIEFSRVVTHEFGHALGLVHEHQSPAAGIAWDREKAYAYYQQADGWDRATVDAQVFDKYSVTQTNYSVFDPNSIMEYWIPAELTLDGTSVAGGTHLSDTDKEYIRRWYPQPPVPGAAQGLLRTGDDCDEIDFRVDYGVLDAQDVGFSLAPAAGITWYKAIQVPVGAGGYRTFEMHDGQSASGTIPKAQIDDSRPIRFWKAKFLGIHTLLGYTWDVCAALPGGSRLSLLWKRDHC